MSSEASGTNSQQPAEIMPTPPVDQEAFRLPTELDSASIDSPSTPLFDFALTRDRVVVRWGARDWLMVLAWTALADLLIFRTQGWAGPASFAGLVPLLFWCLTRRQSRLRAMLVCSLCCWLIGARLFWAGSPLTAVMGVMGILALAMAAEGDFPWVLETLTLGLRSPVDGVICLFRRPAPDAHDSPTSATKGLLGSYLRSVGVSLGLPVLAAIAFGMIFVFANPDVHSALSSRLQQFGVRAWEFLSGLSYVELGFCGLALITGAGLLRPLQPLARFGPYNDERSQAERQGMQETDAPALLYSAYRNTLVTVIVLFVAYLCFEFATLWGRDFPPGFYYAGYAHEGAAWLTVALALATGIISVIFSGKMLKDSRVKHLKNLAWLWSAENLLLAAAVYNRLAIYVGYNGLTRLRWVGFFGITLVVVGFIIVLVKVAQDRSCWWLLRSQLMAFALAIALFSVFPTDYVSHRFNAQTIEAGHPHPAVMIAVKPIDDEGMFPLLTLVDTNDKKIREGVRALLAQRQTHIAKHVYDQPRHWTHYQASTDLLYTELTKRQKLWANYLSSTELRERAIEDFRQYAMQWY